MAFHFILLSGLWIGIITGQWAKASDLVHLAGAPVDDVSAVKDFDSSGGVLV